MGEPILTGVRLVLFLGRTRHADGRKTVRKASFNAFSGHNENINAYICRMAWRRFVTLRGA